MCPVWQCGNTESVGMIALLLLLSIVLSLAVRPDWSGYIRTL